MIFIILKEHRYATPQCIFWLAACTRLYGLFAILVFAVSLSLSVLNPAKGDQPDRSLTKRIEIPYLQFIIDYHFAALRMMELARGTLVNPPMPQVSPDDRVPPITGFAPTEPKATLDEIKSLARQANRIQREEILQAQTFSRDFYGIEHAPVITPGRISK